MSRWGFSTKVSDVAGVCVGVCVVGMCVGPACAGTAVPRERSRAAETIPARTRVVFAHALPPMDGRHLGVKITEVTYPPGGSSAPHRHTCPVIGYVTEGALRVQVQGEPESTYTAGQTFYEAPHALHLVSANASMERPARFLAFFTCGGDIASAQ